MNRLKLHTAKETFERLHAQADKVRRMGAMVKVPRAELIDLLMDHSRMIARLRGETEEQSS